MKPNTSFATRLNLFAKLLSTVLLTLFCFSGICQHKRLVLRHINIVDVITGQLLRNQTVIIDGSRITAIGPNLAARENDTIINTPNRFLIPGLWDMHVHVRNQESAFFPLLIANGVTGVRDMHNPYRYKDIGKWKDSVNDASGINAPYIGAVAGRIVDGDGDGRDLGFDIVNTASQARLAVRNMKDAGADFIKVYNHLSPDQYFALAEEARKAGIPIAGHMPLAVSFPDIVKSGQRSLEHINDLPYYFSDRHDNIRRRFADSIHVLPRQSWRELMREAYDTYDSALAFSQAAILRDSNVFVCPTLWMAATTTWDRFEQSPEGYRLKYVSDAILDKWRRVEFFNDSAEDSLKFVRYYQRGLSQVALLHRAGVRFLAGTDASPKWDYNIPGYGLQFELQLFVSIGLSPLEALQTATINPAIFLHREKDFGSVQIGRITNLLLLEENPLLDIRNTTKIDAVINRGHYLSKQALETLLREAVAACKQLRNVRK